MDTLQILADLVKENDWNAVLVWSNGYDGGWGASITDYTGNAIAMGLGDTIQEALDNLRANLALGAILATKD